MDIHKMVIEHLLFPAMEVWKGNQIRRNEAELKKTEYGGAEAVQRERLASLLAFCQAHVPAYRALPEIQHPDDPLVFLRQYVPLLQKARFQAEPESFLSDAEPAEARISNCTGGSTGEPVHFFMTRSQVEAYEAARWRGLSWYGITQGSRSVMLWGNPVELSAQKQMLHRQQEKLLKNRVILSAYDLSKEKVAAHVKRLNRYRPEYLYGYANILTVFARMIDELGLAISVPLKAVVSTSETLEPWQKKLLERVFQCPVANEYGARDAGILAYTCPQCGRLHITQENCLIEVLDPRTMQPVPDGESGLLAVTDLTNWVQPRLRYLLGDVGAIDPDPCPCGRGLQTLIEVEGREDAIFIRRDGGYVHGNAIGQLLRTMAGIRAFQFHQTSVTEGVLLLQTAPDAQVKEAKIAERIRLVLPGLSLEIRRVEQIDRSPSGKIRYAIRDFPLPMDEKVGEA